MHIQTNQSVKFSFQKGGSFFSSSTDCRAAAREKINGYKESSEIGLRVVIGLPLR